LIGTTLARSRNLFLANSTIVPLPAFGITLDNALASNRN